METPQPIFNLINPVDRREARPLFIRSSLDQPLPPVNHADDTGYIAHLRQGETLYIGSYFNSFYDYEYQKITGSRKVFLSLRIHGRALVRVVRDNPSGRVEIPIEEIVATNKPEWIHFEIPLKEIQESYAGSRLRLELHAVGSGSSTGTGEATLLSGYWGTREPAKREVKLGAVMCTYNNEELCLDNLKRLLSSGILEKEDINLLLVDNAANLEDKLPNHDNLHYASQNNLGGAGGFTRGIMEFTHESLNHLDVSHLLLMDDDISLEPEMMTRVKRLQEHAQDDCVIGGSMLNLTDPCGLHEMGSFYSRQRPGSLSTDHKRGAAHTNEVLNSLGRATEYDYTAWWFCSFSTNAVREAGLPYPLFIRRDDTEYGERLRNGGRKIYCASGVGVWHAPFQGKPITWMQYFDIRNDHVNFALTDTVRPWSERDMARQIEIDVSNQLMRFDYGRAELILMAIEDFLEGPNIVKQDPQIVFKKVAAAYNQYKANPPAGFDSLTCSSAKKVSKLSRYVKRLTCNYQYGICIKPKGCFVANDAHTHWKHIPHNANFAVVNHFWGTYQYFEKRPNVCKTLIKRKKSLIKRFLGEHDQVTESWRSQREELSSVDFWKEYVSS